MHVRTYTPIRVHTSFHTYSDRHVLGLLLCSGVIALCFAVLAALILNNILVHTTQRKKKREKHENKNVMKAKESKETQKSSANNIREFREKHEIAQVKAQLQAQVKVANLSRKHKN